MTNSYPQQRPISHFLQHEDWYEPNEDYQREEVWTKKEKQFLIDSIIKEFAIPQIFVRKLDPKKYEIVDGQQRFKAITQFLKNKYPLSKEYSGDKLGGLYYEKLGGDIQDIIDRYTLNLVVLEDYNDDDVRNLFRRLQAGKPLTPGEKLNAFPGSITLIMRKLAQHPIFNKVPFSLNRYKAYQLISQLFLLSKNGITDIGARYIYNFFDHNKMASENSTFYIVTKKVLNFMNNLISEDKFPEMNKPSWFINYFLFSKYLLDNYNVSGREDEIYKFHKDFWNHINAHKKYNPEKADLSAIEFANNNRAGTNNKKNIQSRLDYMIISFLNTFSNFEIKDEKRSFDQYQRIIIFRRDKGICQNPDCLKKVNFTDFHADHKIPHSKGGKTIITNGQALCAECNLKKLNNPDCGY